MEKIHRQNFRPFSRQCYLTVANFYGIIDFKAVLAILIIAMHKKNGRIFIPYIACAWIILHGGVTFAQEKTCDIEVIFSSYCCGIDRETYKKTTDFLDRSHILYTVRSWGREGEKTLCLENIHEQTEDGLIKGLLMVAPQRLNDSPPVAIKKDGQTYFYKNR